MNQEDKIKSEELNQENMEDKNETPDLGSVKVETGAEKKSDEKDENVADKADSERDEEELKTAVEYLEHLQRLQAEFKNYKKRVERDNTQFAKFVRIELIRKLLPVLDDFERFIVNHKDDRVENAENNDFMKGFTLIYEKLASLLKNEGMTFMKAKGEDFNPNFHEALMMENTDNESQDGKVLEEWEKGYMFNDSVLRVAKVKVGKFNPEACEK